MTRSEKDRRERLHRALAQNEAMHSFVMGFARYAQGDNEGAARHLAVAQTNALMANAHAIIARFDP